MGDRMFLVKTEFDERAIGEAIESEIRELGESPLYGCSFFAKEVTE
nr:MAG TPA: hypothetical protein [Caudoviricetes sp.]